MPKPVAAIVCNKPDKVNSVYGDIERNNIRRICRLKEEIVSSQNMDSGILDDVEVIFSTWGMIPFTDEQLAKMPALKAVFYAAGMTNAFAPALLRHGIKVSCAWQANGVPVAEYAMSLILLGLKNFFNLSRSFKSPETKNQNGAGPGAYGAKVGIIGDGSVSRHLQNRLKNFDIQLMVVPSLPEKWQPGILEKVFSECQVVSNHLVDRADLIGILNGRLFEKMPDKGVFINTGRGRQVNEAELAEVLRRRTDMSAVLDVTYPEPPVADSPLYTLPNVFLSPHLAGSVNDECRRMAQFMIDECQRYINGEDLLYAVDESAFVNLSADRKK